MEAYKQGCWINRTNPNRQEREKLFANQGEFQREKLSQKEMRASKKVLMPNYQKDVAKGTQKDYVVQKKKKGTQKQKKGKLIKNINCG